jgi:hypothetical protein
MLAQFWHLPLLVQLSTEMAWILGLYAHFAFNCCLVDLQCEKQLLYVQYCVTVTLIFIAVWGAVDLGLRTLSIVGPLQLHMHRQLSN